jgi:ABC-2 type transport system permease protein
MSPFTGLLPTFRRALGTFPRGWRMLVVGVLLSLPPLLALTILDAHPARRADFLMVMLIYFYLLFLAPLAGLLFGTGIVLDEANAGTLSYLLTRPARRRNLILGKLLAALLLGWAGLGVSLGATLVLSEGASASPGLGTRAVLSVLLAFPAYLCLSLFLSCLTRWAPLVGFGYAFGLEGILGEVPGMIRKITMLFYSRSLLGTWETRHVNPDDVLGPEGGASYGTSITVLLAVAAAFLLLALFTFARRQFVPRLGGRA